MIEFTIKTLDSSNHHFSVNDGTTVQQLKEKVRDQMGIEINLQRLIFCGRVLQDEKKLSEYDVHGKVVHLVQRAPPGTESRAQAGSASGGSTSNDGSSSGSNGGTGPGTGTFRPTPRSRFIHLSSNPAFNSHLDDSNDHAAIQQEIRRIMSMAGAPDFVLDHHHQMSLSPTAGRLETIRRMIAEIKAILASLRVHLNGEESTGEPASRDVPLEPMDIEPPPSATQDENEPQLNENGDEVAQDRATARFLPRRRSHRVVRAMRARNTQPRHLGQLLEELETLQEEFAPYQATYIRLLRAANDAESAQYTEEQRQSHQRTVDMISDLIHSFAHAYHAISDISFTLGARNSRLSVEAAVTRHLFPMQAHINVIQSNRGRQQSTNSTATSGSGNSNAGNTTSTQAGNAPASATSDSANVNTQSSRANQPTANAAGRNTTQPSVNINIQPDPVTYQLEIETRVPIAVPLENVLNGLNNTTNPESQAQTEQSQPPPSQGQTQNQPGQQNQANRRQPVFFDFENLFRGLGQGGLSGVEVVMSVEEIPQGIGLGNLSNLVAGGAGGGGMNAQGANQADGGVYIAPMAWGATSAEVIQNIVNAMARQGLIPGADGVAVQAHLPSSFGRNQNQPQNQGQTQGTTPQAQGQDQGQNQSQDSETTPQANQEQTNQTNNQSRPSVNVRRTPMSGRSQSQAVSIASMFYDRFLQCDSPHARRRLQRRRELHQQLLEQQERQRAERVVAQNIETLARHRTNLSSRDMRIIVHLLNSGPSRESWLNAALVAISRQLYMSELLHPTNGEPALIPNEFQQLRLLLRSYVQNLITRAGNNESDNAFQSVADYLVEQHADFINNMENIAPIQPHIDAMETIRAFVRSRLPALIACVMSDSNTEMFAARFYAMFLRMYGELCMLVSHICVKEVEGMRDLQRVFWNNLVESLEYSVRPTLLTLSSDIMEGVTATLQNHRDTIAQFVRRRDGVMPDLPRFQTAPAASPMEVSAMPEREESMQTTPPATPAVVVEAIPAPLDAPPTVGSPHTPTQAKNSPSSSTSQETHVNGTDNESNSSSPSRNLRPNSDKPEKSESTATPRSANSDQNIRFVPPMVILQHWGEEWVPVFTRDQQSQRADPPEPYSDAYLSGMPSRKRRCVRQSRPPTTLDGFMNESVREASERTSTADSGGIRAAFREHMRAMARARAATSDDYDPLRYASAARFLDAPRPNKPENPDENRENDV